jgi:2-polyprenyl-3-methyl-5-hydroxy-6-metoxy-1,4-benzoquinol methylase
LSEPPDCGLCGNAALRPLHRDILIDDPGAGPPRFRTLHRCDSCRSLWSALPGSTGDRAYYESKPIEDHELLEGGLDRFRQVRRAVEASLGRRDYSILDVGCAAGAHLTVYGDAVAKHGIEPSAAAGESLRRRGIDRVGRFLEDLAPDAGFDVITCLDVLEHLERPAPFLQGMDRHLRHGGLLVLVTGDIDACSARYGGRRWLYYALPEHCTFYSAGALARFLARHGGYRLERRRRIANQDVDARYLRAFVRAVARETVLKLLPASRTRGLELAGRGRFPFFYDNMLLVFRKPGP